MSQSQGPLCCGPLKNKVNMSLSVKKHREFRRSLAIEKIVSRVAGIPPRKEKSFRFPIKDKRKLLLCNLKLYQRGMAVGFIGQKLLA